jgi:hypothetical protein
MGMAHDTNDDLSVPGGIAQNKVRDSHEDHTDTVVIRSDGKANEIPQIVEDLPLRTNLPNGILPEGLELTTSNGPAIDDIQLATGEHIGEDDQNSAPGVSFETVKTTNHFKETVEVTKQTLISAVQPVDTPVAERIRTPSPTVSAQETGKTTSQQSSKSNPAQLDASTILRDFESRKAVEVREVLDNVINRHSAEDTILGVKESRLLESAYKQLLDTSAILAYINHLENTIAKLQNNSKDQEDGDRGNMIVRTLLNDKGPRQAEAQGFSKQISQGAEKMNEDEPTAEIKSSSGKGESVTDSDTTSVVSTSRDAFSDARDQTDNRVSRLHLESISLTHQFTFAEPKGHQAILSMRASNQNKYP